VLKNGNYLPAPWINVLANPRFGCLVSELGTGYTWWQSSRECKLTPWSNDPVLDPPGEICYLRDEESGELWSAAPKRGDAGQAGRVFCLRLYRYSWQGVTCFCHEEHGVRSEMTVSVPLDDPVKVIRLRLQNKSAEQRHLSITYYAEWVLGVQRSSNASFIITEWDDSARLLLARNAYQKEFHGTYAFLGVYSQTEASVRPSVSAEFEAQQNTDFGDVSWTADRSEFLGRNGTWENPAAMNRERLSGQTGPLYDTCGAVQAKLILEPGAEQTINILLGAEHSRDSAVKLAKKYHQSPSLRSSLGTCT
jgi:cyclic beta-1,2-glucan synthetase